MVMVTLRDVDGLTVKELKAELRKLGATGYSRMRKAELQKELKKELRKKSRKSARKSSPRKSARKSSPKASTTARARKAVGKPTRRRTPVRRVSPSRLRPSMSPRRSPGVAKEASLSKTYKSLPKSRQQRRRQVASLKPGEGRGSPTRGWGGRGGRAPQRGRERHELMDKCGKKCFLEPENEGYPVCAALRTGQGCRYNCGGLQSAYNRARQYKNRTVATRAGNLLERKKCYLKR